MSIPFLSFRLGASSAPGKIVCPPLGRLFPPRPVINYGRGRAKIHVIADLGHGEALLAEEGAGLMGQIFGPGAVSDLDGRVLPFVDGQGGGPGEVGCWAFARLFGLGRQGRLRRGGLGGLLSEVPGGRRQAVPPRSWRP